MTSTERTLLPPRSAVEGTTLKLFLPPQKRGKVPKADGGRARETLAPFRPAGTFPRKRGKEKAAKLFLPLQSGEGKTREAFPFSARRAKLFHSPQDARSFSIL